MNQNKKLTNLIRVLLLAFALMLPIAFAPEVQAAGKVKSVAVTNLPAKTLTLKKGKSKALKVKVTVSGKTSKDVTFKSSKKSVATVSSKGKITAKKNGKANITITSKANAKKKVTVQVTVGTPSTKVALNKTKVSLGKGKKVTLKATVTPKKASNKKVVWTSSKKSVATVSSKGVVTAKKAGTAKITATAADGSGKKATCTVKVGAAVTNVALDKTSLQMWVGGSDTLKATVTPANAVDKSLAWSSSNPAVATVDNGKVAALSAGTATVTAKAADGSGKKATCTVTVGVPVNIAGVSVLNPGTVTVTLTGAQALKAENFAIKTKGTNSGDFNKVCAVDNVSTADNVIYNVVFSEGTRLSDDQKIQVTVNGLDGTGTATAEAVYSSGQFAYNYERIWSAEYNERIRKSSSREIGSPGYGYCSYEVKNLPAGIKYEVSDDGYSVQFYGTPAEKGVKTSTVVATDELKNTFTYTIYWLIYGDDAIAAAYRPQYELLRNGEAHIDSYDDYEDEYTFSARGGSGSYKYSIEGNAYELSINEDSGRVSGTLKAAGTYNLSVKIQDRENNKLTATVPLTINVSPSVAVSGMVKDANGNPVRGASVVFTNKAKADRYTTTEYVGTDSTGMYSAYVAAGTYDIDASYSDSHRYLYSQALASSRSGFDINLALYRIAVYSDNKDIKAEDLGTWYDDDDNVWGDGDQIYVKEGTYHLTAETTKAFKKVKSEINVTVNASSTAPVTAKVTVTDTENVKGTLTLGKAEAVKLDWDYNYEYYKFIPAETKTYYFYSQRGAESYVDADGRLYDDNGDSLASDYSSMGSNGDFCIAYECEQGKTYYIGVRDSDGEGGTVSLTVSAENPVPQEEEPPVEE